MRPAELQQDVCIARHALPGRKRQREREVVVCRQRRAAGGLESGSLVPGCKACALLLLQLLLRLL